MLNADDGNKRIDRSKRVKRLKKAIIVALITAVLIPLILCMILFIKLHNITQVVEKLSEELNTRISIQEDNEVPSVFDSEQPEESTREDLQYDEVNSNDVIQSEDNKEIYLTFDDGPSTNTDAILDILKKYDVKATFFVVGKTDEQSKKSYQRIVNEGHTLGMHSYSHRYSEIYESVDSYSQDLIKLQEYLYEVTGVWSRYCRFPGGSSNTVSKVDMQDLIDYLNQQNITYFDWNIASGDATSNIISKQDIIDNCLMKISGIDTGMILLHDVSNKNTTVEALSEVIEAILEMENTKILPITDETVLIQHILSE